MIGVSAFPIELTVQNRQDCPEDSSYLDLCEVIASIHQQPLPNNKRLLLAITLRGSGALTLLDCLQEPTFQQTSLVTSDGESDRCMGLIPSHDRLCHRDSLKHRKFMTHRN